tara:strand:- start:72 stop:887 length:816 start_codon:yes stop_codon:yes gene_type:complete
MRDYISASQINTYLNCGRKFMYRYVEGLKIPTSSGPLIRGRAIDETANDHFVEKADEKASGFDKGLEKTDFVDLAVSNHDKIADEQHPDGWASESDISRDKTSKFADLYHGSHGKRLKAKDVDSVQKEIKANIKFPETDYREGIETEFLGYIDLIGADNTVVDNKVKGRNTYGNLARDLQMSLYSWVTGIKDIAIALVLDKKVPEAKYITSTVPEASHTAIQGKVYDVLNGIKHGVFLPAPEGSWVCSSKFCEFWNICDYGDKAGKEKTWN